MPVERAAGGASFNEVLERVLDKGITIDAWTPPRTGRFGNAGSSRSALRAGDDDDDDDDDGEPPEGSGSSGAPAVVEFPAVPRRRPLSRRDRTRRRR